MKAFISVSFFVLSNYLSFAQTSFEGIIKWSRVIIPPAGLTTTGLSDKQKIKLNESIAQLESQLKDPKMKAEFDNDPAVKAALEQRLQELKSVRGDAKVAPEFYISKMKNGNKLSSDEVKDNVYSLFQKATNKTFTLNKDKKTYYSWKDEPIKSLSDKNVKVVQTTETKNILNYTCVKYSVTISNKDSILIMNVWVATELKNIDATWFYNSILWGSESLKALSQIEGTPLMIESIDQGFTIVDTVTEIKSQILSDADFIIPADYTEVAEGQ